MVPNSTQMIWMYERMYLSRRYEEAIADAYLEGKKPVFNMAAGPIPGEMHLSNGQEPCAVGVCVHLTAEDVVTATHRPHHIAIAKGVDLQAMTAEIFGKATGLSGGRGGHMHLFDLAVNFSCSGIVGQGLGPAVGAALAMRMQGRSHVAVAFIGDGAANQGAFHEVLNLAAVWKLPFVCVIEDNAYGVSVAKESSTAVLRNADRAAGYGIVGVHVPGNDPEAIFSVAGEAIERARRGAGPSLLEIETYRLAGHFMGDAEKYRPTGEKAALQARDPLVLFRQRLSELEIVGSEMIRELERRADEKICEALLHARRAPHPLPETALECVFV